MNDRIGETIINKHGSKIKLIEYNSAMNITVEFIDYNWICKSSRRSFLKNQINSPYCRTVYGIGYSGEDFYKYKGIRNLIQYQAWRNMIKRCYHEKALEKHDTYKKVSVWDEWHNFSNFYKWYNENYYDSDGETMCLDKDIIHKNSNIYSPETCTFVPKSVNNTFPKCDKARGDLPIGVQWIKADNIYGARCRVGEKGKADWLGRFHDKYQAFEAYKNYKEKHIKALADQYKETIPKKLYDALYKYKVEITD